MKEETLYWAEDNLYLIDQRIIPQRLDYIRCQTVNDVISAIKQLVVRGAPAIGVTAAYGLVIGAREAATEPGDFHNKFNQICEDVRQARPTAVNLAWAVDRMKRIVDSMGNEIPEKITERLLAEAKEIHAEDVKKNEDMGRFGAALIEDGASILTHCNAGALATAGYGTALGVIRAAVAQGKKVRVFADETRPFLQGARLTAWEMVQEKIPVNVICDNMAGYFMSKGEIDVVVTGADRIAANGDVANKIGTLSVAILANEFGIPFYVAAPVSTIDFEMTEGNLIPIEQRNTDEIAFCSCGKTRITPNEAGILNPAFDITPNRFVKAIITEKGIVWPPFTENIKALRD